MKNIVAVRVAVAILCFAIIINAGPRRIYLGYSDDEGGCVFLGWYESGQFFASPHLAGRDYEFFKTAFRYSLAPFSIHRKLNGVGQDGRQVKLKVWETNPEPDLTYRSIEVGSDRRQHLANVLFSTSALPIRVLPSHSAGLTPAIESQLRDRANELWLEHLPERAEDERPKKFTLGTPKVESVDGAPDILVVLYAMDIEEGEERHDDRGSMFFIYSLPQHRIVLSEFGHGEWSFDSTVLTIKPEIYFRINNSPQIFFVGLNEGGWEDIGHHAIYELRTGREILYCY